MERPGEEPLSPLYRRLMSVSRLTCRPDGDTLISHIDITPPGSPGGRIRLDVFFRDGTRDTQYLLPDGTILKGGLSSIETNAEVERVMAGLEQTLPDAGPLPEVIRIPREAFETERRGVRGFGGGGISMRNRDRSIDERRTHALREGVVRFEFDMPSGAFAGYICAVYPHGIFLDMPQKENAAFEYHIPDFLASLGIDAAQKTLSRDEIERIQTHVTTMLLPEGMTKREFVERGAQRICHIGQWEGRVRNAVGRLLRG